MLALDVDNKVDLFDMQIDMALVYYRWHKHYSSKATYRSAFSDTGL